MLQYEELQRINPRHKEEYEEFCHNMQKDLEEGIDIEDRRDVALEFEKRTHNYIESCEKIQRENERTDGAPGAVFRAYKEDVSVAFGWYHRFANSRASQEVGDNKLFAEWMEQHGYSKEIALQAAQNIGDKIIQDKMNDFVNNVEQTERTIPAKYGKQAIVQALVSESLLGTSEHEQEDFERAIRDITNEGIKAGKTQDQIKEEIKVVIHEAEQSHAMDVIRDSGIATDEVLEWANNIADGEMHKNMSIMETIENEPTEFTSDAEELSKLPDNILD